MHFASNRVGSVCAMRSPFTCIQQTLEGRGLEHLRLRHALKSVRISHALCTQSELKMRLDTTLKDVLECAVHFVLIYIVEASECHAMKRDRKRHIQRILTRSKRCLDVISQNAQGCATCRTFSRDRGRMWSFQPWMP